MDQAFRSRHGFGIVDYQSDPALLERVEQRRERDYTNGLKVAAQMERYAHREMK
ncbi:hypothetical protein [Paenisporosarcina cavernae]|uniref:hypothetical protein n=1 Tax=Paenisporosarcina cavernae TaxID=2320858 RepID=UPI0013C486E4|nr:hypothetical protein [Paenisporosarcina cavernae]